MEAIISRYYNVIFVALLLLIIASSFYLGSLKGTSKSNDRVVLSCNKEVMKSLSIPTQSLYQDAQPTFGSVQLQSNNTAVGKFLGSKNGTKYYTPDCASAKRIKPENIIWFQNGEDAKLQGYTPAAC